MYPDSLPIESIKKVVEVIRSGQVKEQVPTIAHELWLVQGYAQKMMLGDPVVSQSGQTAEDILEKLASSELQSQAGVDWSVVAQFALNLLMNWLANRKK